MAQQASKEEIAKRLEKVEFALLGGYSPRQIAKQVDVSVRQVERDRKKIRRTNLELFRKSSPEDRLADLHADIQAIRNKAMKIADGAESDRDKISALSLLQRQADAKFNQYKDLGYIEVLPQRIEITGSLTVARAQQLLQQEREAKKK